MARPHMHKPASQQIVGPGGPEKKDTEVVAPPE